MNIIKKNVRNSKTLDQKKKVLFISLAHNEDNNNIEKNYLLIIKIINIII
jgi:hypothetical protein